MSDDTKEQSGEGIPLQEPELMEEEDTTSLTAIISNDGSGDVQLDGEDGSGIDIPKKEVDQLLAQYHQACQSGDVVTVKKLIKSHSIDIYEDYDPEEKITGLHWAAINNRLSVVKYLIAQGADVNFQAENLHATPLHWAARYGYVYIVDYLILFGADVNIADDQGFNLLHLAVNSSNIILVAYVLFFVVSKGLIDINCEDPKGRTALLWASYQGDSLTVALLLKFGANIRIQDQGGFTALHWGVVKGQTHVISYLIREGGDFLQKTKDGKDCFTIANELNTIHPLTSALEACGFNKDGFPVTKIFSNTLHAKFTISIIPLILIGFAFNLFINLNFYIWFMVLIAVGLLLNKLLNKYVLPSFISHHDINDPLIDYSLSRSPLMSGIFFGSLFWISIVWGIMILPNIYDTETYYSNFSMLLILVCIYYIFVKLVNSDPGVKPANRDDHELIRTIIKDLMDIGKFDTENFCIETWVRKPLRSKYSKFSNGIVSRFDHFCPWVYNDIGLKNHKLFMFFILLVEIGIINFTYLVIEYFDVLEDKFEDDINCGILGNDELCYGYKYDKFTFISMIWSVIQAVWIVFLLFIQFLQICKGVSNFEFNKYMKENRERHDMVHRSSYGNFNTTPEEMKDEEEIDTTRNELNDLHKGKSLIGSCCHAILEIIGIDIDTNWKQYTHNRISIPTDYGIRQNFADFWLTSDVNAPTWQRFLFSTRDSRALLNGTEVDYFTLYDLPVLPVLSVPEEMDQSQSGNNDHNEAV